MSVDEVFGSVYVRMVGEGIFVLRPRMNGCRRFFFGLYLSVSGSARISGLGFGLDIRGKIFEFFF